MDRYNRVWRDPKSPLTPITPIASQVFSFDNMASHSSERRSKKSNGFRGLKPSLLTVPGGTPHLSRKNSRNAKNYSQDFMRLRSVFSPNAQSTTSENDATTPKPPRKIQQQQQETRQFKRSSPVEQPCLSPRVRTLLSRTGNEHLTDLFTRQEIDIQVLIQMTLEDLESLGVRGAKELKLALEVIKFAKRFFQK